MALTLYSSAALEASAVVGTTTLTVDEIICTNTSAGVLYLHIFDTGTLPADTTAPDICIAIPPTSTVGYDPEGQKLTFGSGLSICLSSTAATKTIATAVGVFNVRGSA